MRPGGTSSNGDPDHLDPSPPAGWLGLASWGSISPPVLGFWKATSEDVCPASPSCGVCIMFRRGASESHWIFSTTTAIKGVFSAEYVYSRVGIASTMLTWRAVLVSAVDIPAREKPAGKGGETASWGLSTPVCFHGQLPSLYYCTHLWLCCVDRSRKGLGSEQPWLRVLTAGRDLQKLAKDPGVVRSGGNDLV